jgi:superfamily II DNA or RNA helicase
VFSPDRDQRPPDSASRRDAADGAVDSWVERLSAAAVPRTKAAGTQVHYVLSARETYYVPRVSIAAFLAPTLRDGTLGKARPIEPSALGSAGGTNVAPADRTIGRLLSVSGSTWPALHASSPTMLGVVLHLAIETGRLHWESRSNPPLRERALSGSRLTWHTDPDGRQRLILHERPAVTLLPSRPLWYVDAASGVAGPLDLGIDPELATLLASAPALTERQAARVHAVWRKAIPDVDPPAVRVPEGVEPPPIPILRLKADEFPYVRLSFAYGSREITLRDPMRDFRRRDIEIEAEGALAASGFMAVGWPWSESDSRMRNAYRFATGDDDRWMHFIDREAPKLASKGWRIEIDDDFPFAVVDAGDDWSADVTGENENDWFELDLGIVVEGERIPLLPILLEALQTRTLRAGERSATAEPVYVPLPGGKRFVALPAERLNRLLDLLVELFDNDPLTKEGKLRLSKTRAGLLAGLDSVAEAHWLGAERLQALAKGLDAAIDASPCEPPPEFEGTLREYQRRGVAWLQALRGFGFGAVLADDMGLGKTVQLLAHAAIERAAGRLKQPVLVVAPTSVVPNWRAEIARFLPHLRTVVLTGPDRAERYSEIDGADFVLTTYALLQRDAEELLEREWSLAVLDEAQFVKNPRSKGAQLARRLRAKQRIALTGTPVENHLDELWSIFAFAVPDLLGERSAFTRVFRTPIEKHADVRRRDALALRTRPFLLRRTKENVAADLPPKSEIVHRVELDGAQRDLYETIRLTMHRRVREEVGRRGIERSRIVVLDALLKLRQVCCDPRLLKLPSERVPDGSAKLEALLDMLPDLVDDGRRILLFSQFTSMLDLIAPEIDKLKIPYVQLRGATRDRETPVTRFQNGEIPLFLISLKAGGTGLNLTAADTVIHYDPWWNPAVERQATDRAHRIGQQQTVFVYKLITVGTVEERILEMQARKAELAESLFSETSEATWANLDLQEIDRLFAP